MLDYCGVYIGVSTRFSPLFNFDFSLAINRLGKQNAGKKFLPNFFLFKRRTYSGAFETAAICLLSQKTCSGTQKRRYRIKKTYSSAFKLSL